VLTEKRPTKRPKKPESLQNGAFSPISQLTLNPKQALPAIRSRSRLSAATASIFGQAWHGF
jgi:hypothetical protein